MCAMPREKAWRSRIKLPRASGLTRCSTITNCPKWVYRDQRCRIFLLPSGSDMFGSRSRRGSVRRDTNPKDVKARRRGSLHRMQERIPLSLTAKVPAVPQ